MFGSDSLLLENGFPEMLNIFDCMSSSAIACTHHCSDPDKDYEIEPQIDELLSFELCADLACRANKLSKRAKIAFLVDDSSVALEKRVALKQCYEIPNSFANIARNYRIDDQQICVMFQSSISRIALEQLITAAKKMPELFARVKSESEKRACVADLNPDTFWINGLDNNPILIIEEAQPKRSLILATLFSEIKKRFSPQLIIGVFKENEAHRLNIATYVVTNHFGLTTPIMNIYCNNEDISAFDFALVPDRFR